MTNQEIKEIFSTFQNLNLITLIGNLKANKVARQNWIGMWCKWQGPYLWVVRTLCPLAHGWQKQGIGLSALPAVPDFIRQWDDKKIHRLDLVRLLEEIWQERLEDALAVQGVIEGEPVQVERNRELTTATITAIS